MNYRILIVDDKKGQRELFAGILRKDGYQTVRVPSSKAAVEMGTGSFILL